MNLNNYSSRGTAWTITINDIVWPPAYCDEGWSTSSCNEVSGWYLAGLQKDVPISTFMVVYITVMWHSHVSGVRMRLLRSYWTDQQVSSITLDLMILVVWLLNLIFALRWSMVGKHSSWVGLPRPTCYIQPSKRKGTRHRRNAARTSVCTSNGQGFRCRCTGSTSSMA